jgi:hypothetical protein
VANRASSASCVGESTPSGFSFPGMKPPCSPNGRGVGGEGKGEGLCFGSYSDSATPKVDFLALWERSRVRAFLAVHTQLQQRRGIVLRLKTATSDRSFSSHQAGLRRFSDECHTTKTIVLRQGGRFLWYTQMKTAVGLTPGACKISCGGSAGIKVSARWLILIVNRRLDV